MENRRRNKVAIGIIAAAVLVAVAVPLVLYICGRIGGSAPVDELSNKPYAAEYGLERNDSTWKGEILIKRSEADSKYDYLKIQSHEWSDKRDYVEYFVFNSSKDAKEYYDYRYNYYVSMNADFQDKGENWFEVVEPNVCDASFTPLYYLEDNVILYAEVEAIYYGTFSTDEETGATTTAFDISQLKDYVIGNAAELRRYVLTEVLK